ncbi:NADH-quinone oxidoreductase subunit M [Dyella nitratireducens]|uniref:NADH-quinone oxidoreductase subunit M n=1 Tax=Dyella nitratireducens TaxID=1849580 RepID=A0ABQ1FJ73_9GAMM|nr:NADH-quinone oxidoreductase subunit M [Dyella nitratireducens]GGA17990.1 NADH-quinone oxidoreductase subunit M [Dyella nitratireducens]GLQ44715.1 NADH-quinone oxidoreductase subunit M [Dyella nitratireducens]
MFNHLLSLLIWLPIVGAVPVLLAGSGRPNAARWISLLMAILTFAISLFLIPQYNPDVSGMQLVESHVWIESLNVHYGLGIDGISVALILLTTFVGILVIVGAWEVIQDKPHQYMAAMLVLEGLMIGVFCATDALLFYAFFEAMLIPMFILIGIWGGPRRVYATLKFFIYTFFGSIFMLIGLIYLYLKAGTWDLHALQALPLSLTEQSWLFFAFLIAFAVKVPMVPVHTWLPDAHVEAPTGGSVVLAAVMLKIGGYGFLRFSLPIVPDASHQFAWVVILLSLIAVVYIGYVALVQEDMKKLVAYSSVAHMGFVTLGIFIAFMLVRDQGNTDAARLGMQGAMVQMISHGFVSGAMFSCIGVLYDRLHTRLIKDYGGVINVMPWFGFFYVLFAMANCGLPGTSGFVGEFMVILASFSANPWIALFAAFTLIIGAAYTLWLVKRVLWGEVTNSHVAEMKDINGREWLVLGAFAALTILIGVWPEPLTHLMNISVNQLVQVLAIHKV